MNVPPATIVRRLLPVVRDRMNHTPVLLIEGPRGVGKSTLLAQLAADLQTHVIDFDNEDVLEFSRSNPTLATDSDKPILIDEYQKEPRVLGWIKSRLNKGTSFGMFVLAGSTSFDSLPPGIQSLTGRLQRLTIGPFTQTELDATDSRFLLRAFDGDLGHTATPAATTRAEYVARIMRGGMPLALAQPTAARREAWFRSHINQSLDRDAGQLRRLGRKAELPRLLTRAAGQTASLLKTTRVAADLDLSPKTTIAYLELLESLFLIGTLPAWGSTVSSRSLATPKIHIIDSGLGSHLLRLSQAKLDRRDPSSLTEFGHLLESFAVQELLRHADWLDDPVTAGHWRTKDDEEVDLVLERYDGAIVAVEVKAADHIESKWLTPLKKLRDRIGNRFVAGIALHLGPRGYQADDRIHTVPLERLWTQ